ncbi:MAG: 6-phosphofructokinase, partial [Clostridia bacterium]|nr:6-phosphofructokinase [Clostridia bacterium]
GLAGGANMILIPEIPYEENAVVEFLQKRNKAGARYNIIAIAEGAISVEEAALKRKEMLALRASRGEHTATERLAKLIEEKTGRGNAYAGNRVFAARRLAQPLRSFALYGNGQFCG